MSNTDLLSTEQSAWLMSSIYLSLTLSIRRETILWLMLFPTHLMINVCCWHFCLQVAAKIWEAWGLAAAANKRHGSDGGAVCLCMWWCHGKDLVSNVNNSQVSEAGGQCCIINVLSHSLVSSPWMHSSSNGQQLDSCFREDSWCWSETGTWSQENTLTSSQLSLSTHSLHHV